VSLLLIAVSSFMLALSGALVPGPLFTLTISESAKRGFIAGPLIILGHGILELSLVFLILLGANVASAAEGFRSVISIAGGGVLVMMGIFMLKDVRKMQLVFDTAGPEAKSMHPVLTGVLGSISNPYWVIWWMTVGLGYLVGALRFGIPGVVAFFAGHISADLLWYSLISLTVAKGRAFIGDRGYHIMLYCCGIFLIFFGVWFIIH